MSSVDLPSIALEHNQPERMRRSKSINLTMRETKRSRPLIRYLMPISLRMTVEDMATLREVPLEIIIESQKSISFLQAKAYHLGDPRSKDRASHIEQHTLIFEI